MIVYYDNPFVAASRWPPGQRGLLHTLLWRYVHDIGDPNPHLTIFDATESLHRLENVYFTTHTFLDAGLKMMLAWLAVVAPLVTDLGFVSVKAWAQLDNVQRAAACATLLVIWGLLKGVAKASNLTPLSMSHQYESSVNLTLTSPTLS